MSTSSEHAEAWLDTPLKRWIPANLETLIIFLLLALAIISRFYDLGARAVSHDEVNHVVPSYSLYHGEGYRYDPLSHGPLQFHMMAFSYFLYGDNDFTARIPAAIFSVATVAVSLIAFRRYLGRIGAWAAALMFIISPFMLYYGRYARNEVYIVFWGLLTIYTILRYLERGEMWVLFLFTAVNAFHFTDKATSYIFAAEQLIFLVGYFIDRVTRHEWPRAPLRRPFLILLGLTVLLLATAAGLYLKGGSSEPLAEQPLALGMNVVVASLVGGGLITALFAIGVLIYGLGWISIRSERSFDLLMLLSTLILPLSAALFINLFQHIPLGDLPSGTLRSILEILQISSLDYSKTGIIRSGIIIAILTIIATALGLWWNRRWVIHVLIFYGIFSLFYTTFFTQPEGLAGGFMGALGYWLEQQGVYRGGQPWYYYGLFLIPFYEFLPALGTLAAALIAGMRRLWQSRPGEPFQSPQTEESEPSNPTVALIIYWSLCSLVAFTLAGEKMPWLTTHIALPMILAAGWAIGWLIETEQWKKAWTWRNYGRVVVLAFFSLLAVLTFRTSFRAAYITYDYPYEYLVYAHSAPDPKQILSEIEQISRRTTGGLDIIVAYDNNVRYSYWWYLRHYPNRIDYNTDPTPNIRSAPLILVSSENYSKITSIVRDNYFEYKYMRLWWPNQDYWSLKWDLIEAEYRAEAGSDGPPMSQIQYLKYVWRHISPVFTNASVRNAIWQIWFNRDYTAYAALRSDTGFTSTDWGVSERMTFYIRKDISTEIWNFSTEAIPVSEVVDTYQALTVPLEPERVLGSVGNSAGQFQSPRSIAVAPDGSLYVADTSNHRIQHLSPDGQVLNIWGSFADVMSGNAPFGTFQEPWGVAVAPDSSVYVADTWNHRIQKFTAEGEFVTAWGHFGQDGEPDSFYGPRGIAVDGLGRVYVSDTGNKRVVVFDADGNYLAQFGAPGIGIGQLEEPVGIAVGMDGKVYIADTWNQRVQVFAPTGKGLEFSAVSEWIVDGWFSESLENKPYLAVDEQGNVFVTDPQACRVIEFSPNGQMVRVWGNCDEVDGFVLPVGLAVDNLGGLWVSDAGSGTLIYLKFSVPE